MMETDWTLSFLKLFSEVCHPGYVTLDHIMMSRDKNPCPGSWWLQYSVSPSKIDLVIEPALVNLIIEMHYLALHSTI